MCFIFTEHFDEEQCLCLLLDQQGQVIEPLMRRSLHELRLLQQNARTIVVLPTDCSSLHEVELPWLPERKARVAIPYALEEQLAQNVATLHFSFDRAHYQNNRYLVVVTDKQLIMDLMSKLDALDIRFNLMTLDWFALKENEACVTDKGLLIHDNVFNGALSGELATTYLSQTKTSPLLVFNDSMPSLKGKHDTLINHVSSAWIAERLLQGSMINLCQGELQHDTRQHASKQWYCASAIVALALVASVVVSKAFYLRALNTHIAELDKKIALIYREFFPGATQIISPKFRIDQWLKTGSANSNTSSLWFLLDKLAHAFLASQLTIEQLRFQGRVLSVTLISKNFAALEMLQQRLQQAKVKVTQSQASSHEHQVVATLELSL